MHSVKSMKSMENIRIILEFLDHPSYIFIEIPLTTVLTLTPVVNKLINLCKEPLGYATYQIMSKCPSSKKNTFIKDTNFCLKVGMKTRVLHGTRFFEKLW